MFLNKLSTEKVKVRILHSGAGAVTETDVLLASASNAIIIGFNVSPERKAQDLADSEGVEIRLYTVIYNVANDIKAAMIGMLEYTTREKYLGRAEVQRYLPGAEIRLCRRFIHSRRSDSPKCRRASAPGQCGHSSGKDRFTATF